MPVHADRRVARGARDLRRRGGLRRARRSRARSRRSTSSRRSSTIRTPSARSRRRMRCRTSSPWVASRSPRSRSSAFPPASSRFRAHRDPARRPGQGARGGRGARSAATRSSTRSSSSGSASRARRIPIDCSRNAAARPGDRLVLTKPLGTGLLATAAKNGHAARRRARGTARDDVVAQRGGEPRRARART